jgi:hypothetical protein
MIWYKLTKTGERHCSLYIQIIMELPHRIDGELEEDIYTMEEINEVDMYM